MPCRPNEWAPPTITTELCTLGPLNLRMAAPSIHTRCNFARGKRLDTLSFFSLSPAIPDRTDLILCPVHYRNTHFKALLFNPFLFLEKRKGKKRGKEGKNHLFSRLHNHLPRSTIFLLFVPAAHFDMLKETFTLVFYCWSRRQWNRRKLSASTRFFQWQGPVWQACGRASSIMMQSYATSNQNKKSTV